jgi:hypothetical protein
LIPVTAPAAGTGRRQAPLLCEAMVAGDGPVADWLLTAVKCMEPATVIVGFRCPNGHVGANAKCDIHRHDDGSNLCGYCAFGGNRVPVTLIIISKL